MSIPRVAALAHGGLRDLARAVVPVVCPGCGAPDVRWCDDCAAPWWSDPFRCESAAGRLDVLGRAPMPVWAIAPLEGPIHLTVAAWKDGGRRDLDPFFDDAMARASATLASALAPATLVVPVPSRPAAARRRGASLTGRLARAVSRSLLQDGRARPTAACLRHAGGESGGLASRSRWTNARRGIRADRAPAGEVAVLVDDVVTTGASLARSVEVLEEAGVAVVGALVLAATPGRRSGTSVPEVRLA